MLVCVAELANLYGIDLETACESRLDELAQRAPEWVESFGAHLASARRRMDES